MDYKAISKLRHCIGKIIFYLNWVDSVKIEEQDNELYIYVTVTDKFDEIPYLKVSLSKYKQQDITYLYTIKRYYGEDIPEDIYYIDNDGFELIRKNMSSLSLTLRYIFRLLLDFFIDSEWVRATIYSEEVEVDSYIPMNDQLIDNNILPLKKRNDCIIPPKVFFMDVAEKQGLTVNEVSELTFIPVSQLKYMDQGKQSIGKHRAKILAKVLGYRFPEHFQQTPNKP
jgi:hypothetical protein